MKNIIYIILIIFLACKGNDDDSKKIKITKEKYGESYISIDSVQIDTITFDYIFLFHSKNKLYEFYKIRNQDYSIEVKKKYNYKNKFQNHECYEIADLPTGLTWNILFDKEKHRIYLTDKYDNEALGDTIDRTKVDFKNKTAIIVSENNKKTYKIKLELLPIQKLK
jgi:hypothetical protein